MQLSRRRFGVSVAAGMVNGRLLHAEEQTRVPLRVIAYNIYKLTGWPNQRTLAKRAVAEGQMSTRLAMELSLHSPDIISFSESPSERLTQEVADLLGMNHVRFPSGGSWPGTLLSKYEIMDSENAPVKKTRSADLFTRHWGCGTIKLPGGDPLLVHSAHLYPTEDPAIRLREIRAMLEVMKPDLEAGRSMLLIGDLNHGPDSEEYRLWMDAGWVDTFSKVGIGQGATIKSDTPKRRIDYVMAAGAIAHQVTESRPLFEGAFRLNLGDDNSFALSDHLPQFAKFER